MLDRTLATKDLLVGVCVCWTRANFNFRRKKRVDKQTRARRICRFLSSAADAAKRAFASTLSFTKRGALTYAYAYCSKTFRLLRTGTAVIVVSCQLYTQHAPLVADPFSVTRAWPP